jgi:uncharacterized protein (TIGR02611 family)
MAMLPESHGNSQVRAADSDEDADADIAGIVTESDKQHKAGRLDRSLENFRRTRTGRLAVKIVVTVLGAAVVALGLLLVPLPGPGWLIVFAGLAIWSLEFRWAKRLNGYARSRVSAWTKWYGEQGWPLRVAVGFALLVFIVVVIGAATYLSFGAAPFHRLGLGA